MAPGFRSPLPLDPSRSYCIPVSGQRVCGPRTYVEAVVRSELSSLHDPDAWIRELQAPERQLVEEVRDEMWRQAIEASRAQARRLRRDIVQVAKREYDAWHPAHPFQETSSRGVELVKGYWKIGGRRNVAEADLASSAWQDNHPWSAAFVSYVMREAGAGSDFRYAWAHSAYIRASIDNRLNHSCKMFKGYRLTEKSIEPGDIVAKERNDSGANYDNIRRGLDTHGDIVTEVHPNHVVAIGGNVNQNVDDKELATDGDGRLVQADYFVVIKVEPITP